MEITSAIDSIVDALTGIFNFIRTHPEIVIIIIAAIVLYAIANHLVFRLKGYQPAEKTMCILSVFGKERSLDYLKEFTHMPPEQIEIIKYLREHEPAPVHALGKRFGKHNVEALIGQDYIVLT